MGLPKHSSKFLFGGFALGFALSFHPGVASSVPNMVAGSAVSVEDTAPSTFNSILPAVTANETTASTPASLKAVAGAENIVQMKHALANAKTVSACSPEAKQADLASVLSEKTYTKIIHPMKAGSFRVTSPYGPRKDPISGAPAFNSGVDLAAPTGTPILAMADGVVVGDYSTTGGVYLAIYHNVDGLEWIAVYVHSYDEQVKVKVGDEVKIGQVVTEVGSKGYSTGPHLHFEIRPGNVFRLGDKDTVDPQAFLAENGIKDISKACL